jgi:type IV secretory pathway VirB2 component (pilin)
MEFSVALPTLITVPTTFFGWSYDQTILLVPIAQIFNWLYHLNNGTFNFWLAIAVIIAIAINYWQRLLSTKDVYYFWFPLFWFVV